MPIYQLNFHRPATTVFVKDGAIGDIQGSHLSLELLDPVSLMKGDSPHPNLILFQQDGQVSFADSHSFRRTP